jgi:hypothetical protein
MRFRITLLLMVSAIGLTLGIGAAAQQTPGFPSQLDDREFWRLVSDLSEPDGSFQDENYLSNETGYQRAIPRLKDAFKPGGIYVGVGPEQNFTYIAALQPRMAFVIDVRRQNMMEHLMYKALFELSSDRSDFVSRLFSRARPAGLTTRSTAEEIFQAFGSVPGDKRMLDVNLAAVLQVLTERHGFPLTMEDRASVGKVYNAFYEGGPELQYAFRGDTENHLTYAQMMTRTDADRKNWSYLAAEDNFQRVQQMQAKNLIVPVVGDFAGPKAVRAVGQYVREHGGTVDVFYVSNVEPYLFGAGTWKAFYENVKTLSVSESSVFVRTFFGATSRECRGTPFQSLTSLLSSIPDFLKDYSKGDIRTQCDLIPRSK